ncbi:MAG: IS1 family transposase [Akkermansiaceae bacterium]|nr:IS1 family transposase [Armatimonadota bacterium]
MMAMTCPHCHDTEIIRSGRNASGTARFRCKACGKTWVQNPQRRKLSAKNAELIVAALAERVSQRGIARALRVSRDTIRALRKKTPTE